MGAVTAVFVHGVPETPAVWRGLLATLDRPDTVALSLPGFDSARPVPQIGCWQADGGVIYQDPGRPGSSVRILDLYPARIVISARARAV